MNIRIAVIGAGPGGYAAAFYAADLGMQVTLIDPEKNPGGVCLYRGCIPSKALLHVAKVLEEATHASAWGIDFGKPRIDVKRLRGYKDQVVEKLTSGTGQVAKLRKITYLQGRATIVDPQKLQVALVAGGEQMVEIDHVIIATGSEPTRIPAFTSDSPRVLDSTGALDLPEIPASMLVIGGGYIGLELGSVYAALGTKVSVVEMTDGLLPGADRDLVRVLAQRVEKTFQRVMLSTKVQSMKATANSVTVTLEGEGVPSEATYDYVLVSIGRRPNARIPGLEKTKVQVTDRGFIQTDFQRRTDEPTIFAIGDVAGEPMLAHKASHEARVAVEAIAGHKAIFEPLAIPAVVFTDPEIAWAGLTETQAEKEGRKVDIARFPWGASGRAISIDRVDGMTKLLVDPETERILGVGIVGSGAGELIAEGVLAIEMGATASDVKMTIHPHPTLSETVMESAEQFFGTATHVFKPKRK
ncbi:MAG TPA: dihydrolipoyl dehydrogenase [Vicinamibacterales bacterium]|nr:dihydrolipoyl dehydrogenase [Vicinamibacterales bacterium]